MSLLRRVQPARLQQPMQPDLPSSLARSDRWQVVELFRRLSRQHLHLDWQTLPDLLDDPDLCCWVVRQNGSVYYLLGATIYVPPQPEAAIAWLRLALSVTQRHSDPTLDSLWEALHTDLVSRGVKQVGLLAVDSWVETLAARWGFQETNSVVTLLRLAGPVPLPPSNSLRIRGVGRADFDRVMQIDTAAFSPLWQYNRATLKAARLQATTFTLIEYEGQTLGYQLSTSHINTGHLARLAVKPEAQGQGLGGLLVANMLRFFEERGINRITVNTQADNQASHRLYSRLGFEPSGHSVPVWTLDL